MDDPTLSRVLTPGSFRAGDIVVAIRPVGSAVPDASLTAYGASGTTYVGLGFGSGDSLAPPWHGTLAALADAVAPADLVVVDADVTVPPGWIQVLAEAGRERTDVATVVPLVSETAAVGERRHRHPLIAPAVSVCTFITRRALNVVGVDDLHSSFGASAAAHGFVNVLADELVVTTGGSSAQGDVTPLGLIDVPRSSAAPIHLEAGRAPGGLVIAVDAELINASLTGTYEASLAISLALARQSDVAEVYWVAPVERAAALAEMLATAPGSGITVTTFDELADAGTRVDVAFRPYQDFYGRSWPSISDYSDRNIVWTLDLIANVTPSYARSAEDFHRLNRTSAQALDNADAIAALSPHVLEMLEAYGGGNPDPRVFVLPAGAPEGDFADPGGPFENEALAAIGDRPFVLMLGSNYAHKGRAWFIRMARRVLAEGWDGVFVLAGPSPEFGSSTRQEQAELRRAGDQSRSFVIAGRVSGKDRARLMARAVVTVSPSVTEGWGMTPSEGLAFGSTPLSSRGGALRDVSPTDALVLDMTDDAADASVLHRLLTSEPDREAQRQAWARQVHRHSWDGVARTLVEQMHRVIVSPRRFRAVVDSNDAAREPVRGLRWRLLSRVLPEGNGLRTAVGKAFRRARGTN